MFQTFFSLQKKPVAMIRERKFVYSLKRPPIEFCNEVRVALLTLQLYHPRLTSQRIRGSGRPTERKQFSGENNLWPANTFCKIFFFSFSLFWPFECSKIEALSVIYFSFEDILRRENSVSLSN
ncbi:hypothetical protein CEXT_177851 [Caerostris extrusa]|uniref:Uncharacterized protein n=1 Tax=Caerostris extrusa TaxID=172846 RepID=A0AAV4W7S7_CAEEX|nr:hypothetical protein CEXT_177851 [Caerostris extrusa]